MAEEKTIVVSPDLCDKYPEDIETLIIGRQMENNYRSFTFDCSKFDVEIASVMLVHQRKSDVAPYIVTNVSDDNTLTWNVSNTDTTYDGFGKAELRVTFTDGLAKSFMFSTYVVKSITGDTTIPAPLQSWYDAMIDYINENSISPEELGEAIEEYIAEHPVESPVQSVNGKTGDVVLDATDVGALPDSTVIPTVPTNVSAFTNDAGYLTSYTETDPTVPAWAKASTKPTYTASEVGALPDTYTAPVSSVDGKTGSVTIIPTGGTTGQVLAKKSNTDRDVEWQTVSSGGAVSSVNGKTGVVVLKTSDLQNDSGFLTSESDPVFTASPAYGISSSDITAWNGKQDALTFDDAPTANSNNPVKSGGIYTALQNAGSVQTVDGFSPNGSGAVTTERILTQAQYDLLSSAEKNNGMTYYISDAPSPTAPVTSVNGMTGAVVIGDATTSSAGLMSATDKSHLDAVYADYSSALVALGVI